MTILDEIISWSSKTLLPWQQEAVARIYQNGKLTSTDRDDLFAMAKGAVGIADPQGRQPRPLVAASVVAPQVPNRLVELVSIKDVTNVNALAQGADLPLARSGLTVIYGENGAGKSGYSRILKRACRARDQNETILTDARKPQGAGGTPEATFSVIVDGQSSDLRWLFGQSSPEQLSEIAIFDSHCARAYIDNKGDFAYAPYGLDILTGLVAACTTLKDMATKEKSQFVPNTTLFASLTQTQTEVGTALKGIPGTTRAEDIERLAKVTADDLNRLDALNKALAEADPKQKAQVLRLRAKRFSDLSVRIAVLFNALSDPIARELYRLVTASKTAKKAAELAAKSFKETPGLLTGTGGDVWKTLVEAAREFAAESHAGHSYPDLPPSAACPLCQNPLGVEGAARLATFDAFIEQAAEKAWKAAQSAAKAALQRFQGVSPLLALDDALRQELTDSDSSLIEMLATLAQQLADRHAQVVAACMDKHDWDAVQAIMVDPRTRLDNLTIKLNGEAAALEASMNEKLRVSMLAERAELDARNKLRELKPAVLDALAKFDHCAKLQRCIDSLGTTSISRKATDLSKTMATEEVAAALNAELRNLNVHELQVVMKPESPGGKTQFKLALQLPGGNPPSAILSEGEQRAIAIASFLTEVKLAHGRGGIVFDDPVSSLDHRRRWHVAERIAAEAKDRQVIVFTHDIYFLCILQQKADEVGVSIMAQCVRRTPEGFGVRTERLPFDAQKTKARIGVLRQAHVEVERAKKAGDDDLHKKLTRDTYTTLRLAWERAVEEILFSNVVQRFAEGVSTQSLHSVIVEDSDYKAIDDGMTKCSKFAHDAALSANLPTPHPDELKADIEKLEAWRDVVEKRKEGIKQRRTA